MRYGCSGNVVVIAISNCGSVVLVLVLVVGI